MSALKDFEVKVKIAVLCFVILCTWYVYSVHNRCCPPTHNLYLLLCSYHWDIYEQPSSMIIVHRRQSQTWYSGFPLCQDSSFSHSCVCYSHSRTKSSVFSKNCSGIPCCRQGKNYPSWSSVTCPRAALPGRKLRPSSPLVQSGFIATFISFNFMWRWDSLLWNCWGANACSSLLTAVELVTSGRGAE